MMDIRRDPPPPPPRRITPLEGSAAWQAEQIATGAVQIPTRSIGGTPSTPRTRTAPSLGQILGTGFRFFRWARIALAVILGFIGGLRGVSAVTTPPTGAPTIEQSNVDNGVSGSTTVTDGMDGTFVPGGVEATGESRLDVLPEILDPSPADITMSFVDLYNEVHYAPAGAQLTGQVTSKSLAVLGSVTDVQVRRLFKGSRDVGTVLIAKIDPEQVNALRSRGDFMLGAVRVAATHASIEGEPSYSFYKTVSSRGRRGFYFRGGIVYDVNSVHRRLTSRVIEHLAVVYRPS